MDATCIITTFVLIDTLYSVQIENAIAQFIEILTAFVLIDALDGAPWSSDRCAWLRRPIRRSS